ncbi:MAG: hypothetical protein FGM24_08290 [Candidatus Kapabacteria bacterium]|nr:hypothetical protein [Candidatus Kapabacteria bacterium]
MTLRSVVLAVLAAVLPLSAAEYEIPIANPLEARILTMWQVTPDRMRLDIGASPSLLRPDARFDVGVDFFTLTRLRSEGNFKFPVETIDYWFGLYGTYVDTASPLDLRIRVAHISTHLVDGMANDSGVFGRQRPFVYSREFIESLAGWRFGIIRPYAGFTYVWAVQPRRFARIIPQVGVNMRMPLTSNVNLAGGYDGKLVVIDDIRYAQHAAQIGIEWSTPTAVTNSVNLYRYDGRSLHGMMMEQDDHYWAIGLQMVF